MRVVRILGYSVGILVGAAALLLLTVWLFVDPTRYRGKIAAAAKDATGRDLMLQGDIKLSLFPWVALEFGPATLGNPPGFSPQPFVSLRHASVRAKLLPLIRERLEIVRVEIDGLDVRLERNVQGTGNWQGFGRPADDATAPSRAANQPLPQLPGIKITEARVTFHEYTLKHFNLETAPFVDGVVPISLGFEANRGVANEHATVECKVDLSHPTAPQYRLAALTLVGQLAPSAENRPIRWNMSAPRADIDLDAQTLAVPIWALSLAGAQLNGALQGTAIRDDLRIAGSVTLAPVVIREFMPRLGLTAPRTRDPRAFAQLSGKAKFSYGANMLRFDEMNATLDDTHVRGSAGMGTGPSAAVDFDLSADAIDADRYLAPDGQAAVAPTARSDSATLAPSASGATGAAATSGVLPTTAPPPAPPRPLEAQGKFTVGSLHLSPLNMTDLRITLAAKDGLDRLFPLEAQVNGGRYSGDVTLDRRGSVPKLKLDEHLSGIDMASIIATRGKAMHLSGKGNLNLKAQGQGASADALLKSFNGRMDATVAGGALEGIDLGYELGRAEALIKRADPSSLKNTDRTPFDAFKLSADITNGAARTRDLVISSPVLRVTGEGSAELASRAIDFRLLADTRRTAQGVPLQIPLTVTGTTANPVVRPDIAALAQGQLRRKLEDVLHDKLQGLFGKP